MRMSRRPGRPRSEIPVNNTGLRLRLDDADWSLLGEVAAAEKLPKSEVMRRALRAYAPVAIREVRRREQALEEAAKSEGG